MLDDTNQGGGGPSDPYAEGYKAAHREVIAHAQAHINALKGHEQEELEKWHREAINQKIASYEHVIAWSRGKLDPPTADLPPGIIAISLGSPEDVGRLFDILGDLFGKDEQGG